MYTMYFAFAISFLLLLLLLLSFLASFHIKNCENWCWTSIHNVFTKKNERKLKIYNLKSLTRKYKIEIKLTALGEIFVAFLIIFFLTNEEKVSVSVYEFYNFFLLLFSDHFILFYNVKISRKKNFVVYFFIILFICSLFIQAQLFLHWIKSFSLE